MELESILKVGFLPPPTPKAGNKITINFESGKQLFKLIPTWFATFKIDFNFGG